ncbi:MAG: hypothetical protein ACOYOK_01700 [Pseudobdellovibrionaceae bacterium]
MSIRLQNRDIQILKFIFAFRVASYRQILARYFRDCHRTAAYRRIRDLRKENLLKLESTVVNDQSVDYFRITDQAWQLIKNSWPFDIDTPYFKSESPDHDLRLSEIFFRMENLKSFRSFMTENLLQSSSELKADIKFRDLAKLYADGALVLKGPDGQTYVYGIELELSKKARDRYSEKLKSYYKADGIDGVIYIASSQEISNALTKSDDTVCTQRDSILYLGSEDDVLKSDKKIYFKNSKANGIELF